jgi:S-adenosylmethionine uptake transporter
MLTHCFFISGVVITAKFFAARGFHATQIVFFHSFIAFLILLPLAAIKEKTNLIKTSFLKLHLIRGFFTAASLVLYFYAIKFIPVTDARAVALLGPAVTFIAAIVFLKETLDLKKILALILSLIGGYIILNPSNGQFHFISLLVLLAMFMWTANDLIIKKMSRKESNIKQLFFLTGLTSIFSLPFTIIHWKQPEGLLEFSLLFGIGLLFLINLAALFLAFKYADLTTLMPFDFSGMIFTAILSYFIFYEVIKRNTLIGSIIVFFSSAFLIIDQKNKKRL